MIADGTHTHAYIQTRNIEKEIDYCDIFVLKSREIKMSRKESHRNKWDHRPRHRQRHMWRGSAVCTQYCFAMLKHIKYIIYIEKLRERQSITV